MKHFLFPLFLFLSLPVGIVAQDETKSPPWEKEYGYCDCAIQGG